ncbi:carboxymuconolactone decarboxylase family protein [Dyella sp. GSA-30]|uniref:carboxymuconolactone decarboxylase family protein n=1 Tax=Dyella sp. GSA-30 TaxID=2994496 RepID=UPI002490F037|nr:carboxymuconolactone decarboxylase family protein [Dyella sp. GSA-30]BDU22523.1 alkyl hydroperoxide reductase AhpD [Dyella sp. GSA-30]
MSRIAIPAIESATGATADVYARVKKIAGGRVPNTYAALGYVAPSSFEVFLDAHAALAQGSLSQQELQTIKLLVSVIAGCDVCVAAHSLLGRMAGLSVDALRAIRAGTPTGDARRDALVRFVSVLQTSSGSISQGEFAAIRAVGYTDTQLAEISLAIGLITFTNTFNRINDTDVDFPPME